MLSAALLPLVMFGLLALAPSFADTSTTDNDPEEPMEPEDPDVPLATISTDGSDPIEATIETSDAFAAPRLEGTDSNDTIVVDTSSDEEFFVAAGAGDDDVTVGLYQDVSTVSGSTTSELIDDGSDVITVEVDADLVAQLRADIEEQTVPNALGPIVNMGPADSLRFDLPDDLGYQIVRIDTELDSIPDMASNSDQTDFVANFLLVPDTVDLASFQQQLDDQNVPRGAGTSFAVEDLVENYGAVGLATVRLGSVGFIQEFDNAGPTGDVDRWDTRFELTDVEANSLITLIVE